MKSRYSSAKSRNKFKKTSVNGRLAGSVAIFIAAVLVIAGIYIYFNAYQEMNKIGSDYCTKVNMKSITVILIDHTDNLNAIQRASLERRLWEVASSVPKNSLFKVYTVGNTEDNPLVPVLEKCNPGDEGSVSRVSGNPEFTKRKYESEFKNPIQNVLNKVIVDQGDNVSPIMESLQSLSVTSFIEEKYRKSEKRLILVSDLLQHSKGFSVYKEFPDFSALKNTAYWRSVKADFDNVDVKIYFLNRRNAGSLQTARLLRLWSDYFDNLNAHISGVTPIEG